MLITLRLPRSSASRLNLAVGDMDGQERDFVTTLTAVELAGRLSLATGKPISPEAVVGYCIAWQAASETLASLVKKHGSSRLAKMVRKSCSERALWAPRTNASTLKWLQCVLEAFFLSGGERAPTTPRPEALAAEQQEAHDGRPAPVPEIAQALADICETNFPLAYRLWSVTVA